jgi:hypothetical protein|tara:strand:+ start:1182 stop:1601 length:420 start_codon:yes stop_codon:yes gene_type:complete
MATVRASLSLNSADVLTSALALTTVANLRCDSGALIRAKVKGTAVGTSALKIYPANQCNERAYLYVKNLDVELEQYVYIYNDDDSNGLVAKIGGGEFAFVPVAVDKSYVVYATKVDTMVEYGVFGNDNSTVPFTGAGAA